MYFYLNVYHAAYGGTGAECKKVLHAYSDTQKDVSRSKNVYHAPQFYQKSRFTYDVAHVILILGGRIVAKIRDTHLLHFPGKRLNNR